MKLKVYTQNKAATGTKDLPAQFSELVRPDLVKKAVEAVQANRRQPQGAKRYAGMMVSAKVSRRRRDYRGSYGHGMSRVPRKILTRRGTQFYWVGAFAPGTVGGRRAHPPKSSKILESKINKKERRMAIRSAIAATVVAELVKKRGHKVPDDYPFIIQKNVEDIKKTSEAITALNNLGLRDELERSSERKIRPGKGKMRGRRYMGKKGPLIVVSKRCALAYTARNIPGVDVVEVNNLNAELLAPGAEIGRLTLFTDAAIDRLANERLFMNDYHGQPSVKKEEAKKPEAQKAKETKQAKQQAKQKTQPKEKASKPKK